MGSYIMIAVGLAPEFTGADVVLLVDWQKGHLTTVGPTGCDLENC